MPDLLLDIEDIMRLLGEVADELDKVDDDQHRIIVVGGALLAWYKLRAATRDIDSVTKLDEATKQAAAVVGERNDIGPSWLNDAAKGFLPRTFDETACDLLLDRTSLRVLGATPDQVFIMKLFASRAADTDDLETLWPNCSFVTVEDAVEAYYAGYPHEERDPYLADRLRSIL